jgi:hypothetical protein
MIRIKRTLALQGEAARGRRPISLSTPFQGVPPVRPVDKVREKQIEVNDV